MKYLILLASLLSFSAMAAEGYVCDSSYKIGNTIGGQAQMDPRNSVNFGIGETDISASLSGFEMNGTNYVVLSLIKNGSKIAEGFAPSGKDVKVDALVRENAEVVGSVNASCHVTNYMSDFEQIAARDESGRNEIRKEGVSGVPHKSEENKVAAQ